MKKTVLVTVLSLCLFTAVGVNAADREVTVKLLDQQPQSVNVARSPAGDCLVGNLYSPYFAIPGWLIGLESYMYMFDAEESACACAAGFAVEAVHMYLQFEGAESFDMSVGFNEAVWDPASGCWVPGPEICRSPIYTVAVDNPGLYDIVLPVECECAFFGYWYGISVNFESSFAVSPDIITDNVPLGCVSWNDYGGGWEDLNSVYGFPGELSIYADVVCCQNPVADEANTFGGVKSLFR